VSFIANSGAGLVVEGSTTVSVGSSNFLNTPSGAGITNKGTQVTATNSWWGRAAGPGAPGDTINGSRAAFVNTSPVATALTTC
jgi:hypothetical protein